jgi:hypothetical protein
MFVSGPYLSPESRLTRPEFNEPIVSQRAAYLGGRSSAISYVLAKLPNPEELMGSD